LNHSKKKDAGKGVWFAKNSSYSHNFAFKNGSKIGHMILARVLIGKKINGFFFVYCLSINFF
jgi:hypothetical protein